MDRQFNGKEHVTFIGVVENRNDPMKLNRVQVRCYGYDTEDKSKVPTSDLPWAIVKLPVHAGNRNPAWLIEGATVTGYFLDGRDQQQPIVDGVLTGMVRQGAYKADEGFTDPRGTVAPNQFPTAPQPNGNEPDRPPEGTSLMSGLWTGSGSIINSVKNILRKPPVKGVGEISIEEPMQPYGAKYPFNHGYESESGSGYEIDDTPSKERVHIFHRVGSYIEIHPDGTIVKKSVADNSLIVLGNNKTIIAGDAITVIEGTKNLRINGNVDIEVSAGDVNISVNGNVKQMVTGNVMQQVEGNLDVKVAGNVTYEVAGNLSYKVSGDISIQSNAINYNISGNWSANASRYNWN